MSFLGLWKEDEDDDRGAKYNTDEEDYKRQRADGDTEADEADEETDENEEDDSNSNSNSEYEIDLMCDNCGDTCTYSIPLGKTYLDFKKEQICKECGCNLVQPAIRDYKRGLYDPNDEGY